MAENYQTFRAHVSLPTFSDPGTESADFLGDKFIGEAQGDHHSTALEIDLRKFSQTEIALLEEAAKLINSKSVQKVGGQWVGLRLGLWDKIAPVQAD